MSSYTVNMCDKVTADITCKGKSVYNFDDRKNKWAIWNLSLYLDGVEDDLEKKYNLNDFSTLKRLSPNAASRFVYIKQIIRLKEDMYKFSFPADFDFNLKVSAGKPGKTSMNRLTQIFDNESGMLILEKISKFAKIDAVSRRPVPHPDWFLERYSSCNEISGLDKKPIPQQPNGAFEYRTVIRYSDYDSNEHTNQSVYIKSCMDCATIASVANKLVHFKGDIASYPVLYLSVDFLGETFAGDELVVRMTQDVDNISLFRFWIETREGRRKVAYIECEFGLNAFDDTLNNQTKVTSSL